MYTKEFIRKSQKEKIKNLSDRKEKDLKIVNYLKKFIYPKKNILIYNPLSDEPNISILLELFDDVTFLLPKISSPERRELSYINSNFFTNGELQYKGHFDALIAKLSEDKVASAAELQHVFDLTTEDTVSDLLSTLNHHLAKTNTSATGAQLSFVLLCKVFINS